MESSAQLTPHLQASCWAPPASSCTRTRFWGPGWVLGAPRCKETTQRGLSTLCKFRHHPFQCDGGGCTPPAGSCSRDIPPDPCCSQGDRARGSNRDLGAIAGLQLDVTTCPLPMAEGSGQDGSHSPSPSRTVWGLIKGTLPSKLSRHGFSDVC